ncbi:MAG: c-type cytochrome [Candidatus Hydrothermarchaeales archaeon]
MVTPLIAGVILGTALGYSVAPAVVAEAQAEVKVKYTESIQSENLEKWDIPFEINAKDVEDGKLIFEKWCFYCHGVSGDGEGPLAHELDPKPADFTDVNELPERLPNYLFTRISEGGWDESYDSAMPRWMGILSEDEIWKVISYTYYLSGLTNITEGGTVAEQGR